MAKRHRPTKLERATRLALRELRHRQHIGIPHEPNDLVNVGRLYRTEWSDRLVTIHDQLDMRTHLDPATDFSDTIYDALAWHIARDDDY